VSTWRLVSAILFSVFGAFTLWARIEMLRCAILLLIFGSGRAHDLLQCL
jgi:hypothetical protein